MKLALGSAAEFQILPEHVDVGICEISDLYKVNFDYLGLFQGLISLFFFLHWHAARVVEDGGHALEATRPILFLPDGVDHGGLPGLRLP